MFFNSTIHIPVYHLQYHNQHSVNLVVENAHFHEIQTFILPNSKHYYTFVPEMTLKLSTLTFFYPKDQNHSPSSGVVKLLIL